MSGEIETRAREMGWVPKEEFRGDPERFVDADTFVKRGEEFLPILKATTRKQVEQINELQGRLTKTESLLKEANEAIQAVRESTDKAELDRLRGTQKELKAEIKKAREEEDIDRELELQNQLTRVSDTLTEAGKPKKSEKKEAPKSEPDPMQDPVFKGWVDDNPWFNTDRRKTALAVAIADDLRAGGDKTTGRAFFDKVTAELNKTLGIKDNPNRETPSKTEGGSRGSNGGGSGGGGKTYADLPPEAKEACDRQSSRLVGPNKIFKDEAAWRAHYVTKFFEE